LHVVTAALVIAAARWGINVLSFWDGVGSEGSAGSASTKPSDGQPQAAPDAVALHGFYGVLRAGGCEPAG